MQQIMIVTGEKWMKRNAVIPRMKEMARIIILIFSNAMSH
jgi:hypothetical protein